PPSSTVHPEPLRSPAEPGGGSRAPGREWSTLAGAREALRPARLAALAIALVACVTIVIVGARQNQTFDEPAHIAAGMQWRRDGRYSYDVQHPPLARMATALAPMLDGARSHQRRTMWE